MLNNLKIIIGEDDPQIIKYPRQIYANFGKYLVDYFRSGKLDKQFVEKFVRIENLEYMDNALEKGKGAIGLTAHMGNWELSAQVLAMLGYKMNAIALTHIDKRIDSFFNYQRTRTGVKIIPVGVSVRRCFVALKHNEIVGILGDRDFSGEHGIEIGFLKKSIMAPRGPAVLSLRTGAAIVPAFVIRDEKDDLYFRYVFEEPIYPEHTGNEEQDIKNLTEKYIKFIERYVKLYPKQWFRFTEFWKTEKAQII